MYTSPSLLLLPFALSITRATPSPPPLIFRDGTLATYKTQNDLTDGSPCKPMTIIFARGTTEPGNVGTITGPPFFAAVSDAVGANNLAVQGVPYPADIPGFLAGGDAGGSATLAKLVQQATTQCPDTKVVMSGYSQGGQLVHNSAKLLCADTASKVSSVVIFSDPDDGEPVAQIAANKVQVICHPGDNICDHGDLILPPHLTYSMNAGQVAILVSAVSGLGMGNSNVEMDDSMNTTLTNAEKLADKLTAAVTAFKNTDSDVDDDDDDATDGGVGIESD